MWRKHKTQLNRSRLHKQIAWCNRLANKDKSSYYTNLITANSDGPKKLWQSLRKVLHRTSETVLPAHRTGKRLADTFASFFTNKISKIRDTFSTFGSFNAAPDLVPPAFNAFKSVTEDEVSKCINESPTKSCPLEPIPTFFLKDCLEILLPSITKLINYSLIDGSFPSAFKRAVVTPSLTRLLCPETTLRIIAQCLIFVSCQSWLSELLLSNLHHTSITTNWTIHISQLISQDTPLKQLYCQ